MFKHIIRTKTSLTVNESLEGETLENKIKRITQNNEPITDGAPIIYQDRKNGIEPQYDIRTDRFDFALDAMSMVQKTKITQREERMKAREKKEIGKTESTHDTETGQKPA